MHQMINSIRSKLELFKSLLTLNCPHEIRFFFVLCFQNISNSIKRFVGKSVIADASNTKLCDGNCQSTVNHAAYNNILCFFFSVNV